MGETPLLHVKVRTKAGELVHIETTATDSVVDLKACIHKKIGLHPDNQKLLFGDATLAEDLTLLKALGIQSGSVLDVTHMQHACTPLFVKTPTHKTLHIKILR